MKFVARIGTFKVQHGH